MMKALFVLMGLLFSFSAFAGEISANNKISQFKNRQAQLKSLYENSQRVANKQAVIADKAQERREHLRSNFPPDGSCDSIVCQTIRVKNKGINKSSGVLHSIYQYISNIYGSLRSYLNQTWIYTKFRIKKHTVGSRSASPDATGLHVSYLSDGPRPLVEFTTLSPMYDPDGTVERVEIDFGDGTSMEIPASELDGYATIHHIYPQASHYNVTLQIFDNDDDYVIYGAYAEPSENKIPIPVFSVDVSSGASPLTVSFESEAFDEENHNLAFFWDHGDGTFSNSGNHAYEYEDSGTYDVYFAVQDELGGIHVSSAQIFVDDTPPTGGSRPSIVFRSSDLIGSGPHTVYFDAFSSFDIDGNIVSYSWNFGDGGFPDNTATTANPKHTYRQPGTYFGRLTVTDNGGRTSDHYFEVVVEGENIYAPHVIAQQLNPGNPLEITFDMSRTSIRSNVTDNKCFWDYGDSSTATGCFQGPKTYSSAGTYTVTLITHDIRGARHVVQKDITISSTYDAPTVALEASTEYPEVFQYAEFDASGSVDSQESEPLEFIWDFFDDTHFDGSDYEYHAYSNNGMVRTELIVTNTRGISSLTSINVYPYADSRITNRFVYTPQMGPAPLEVGYFGGASTSENAEIVEYIWRIRDDGSDKFLTGPSPTYEYTNVNTKTYRTVLFTKDSLGNVAATTRRVYVVKPADIPSGNLPPNATFSATPDIDDSYLYTFNASGSSDPDNAIRIYEWSINGDIVYEGSQFTHRFPESSVYQVSVKVYDQWGASDTHTEQIDISSVLLQQLSFEFAPIIPIASQNIHFGAHSVVIPGATIVSYDWDFGDSSSPGSGVSPTHTYSTAGTYTVTLTVTDNNTNTYIVTKDVVVGSALANPTLALSIKDTDLLTEVTNSGTYRGSRFPETVYLSVRGTKNANAFIKNATWDFGNGDSGVGADVVYTYKQPGTYTVSVTGYDANDNSSTASATIIIPNNCSSIEVVGTCLTYVTNNSGMLELSEPEWEFEAPINLSTDPLHRPARWIYLLATDGSDIEVDLSDVTTVTGDQIKISRDDVLKKRIDLTKPYRLFVNTVDTNGDMLSAQFPSLVFGAGTLRISIDDTYSQVVVTNPSAQYRKYIDMGNTTSISLKNLPLGPTSVIAFKGEQSTSGTVTLSYQQQHAVSLELTTFKKRALASNPKTKGAPNYSVLWKNREAWATRNDKVARPQSKRDDLPAYAYSLCGEEPPFNPVKQRQLSPNQDPKWSFSSNDPMAQDSFRPISQETIKPVRLSCGVSAESLMYGHARWKYKDGVQRCSGINEPHWYWAWYLNNLSYENSVVTIKYEVTDDWTGETFSNYIVTSAADLRQRQGRELTQVTQRVGIVPNQTNDWAYRQDFDLIIPPHFQRPQIRFELDSEFSETEGSFYSVTCDVLGADSAPKVIGLAPTAFNPTSNRAASNAQYSLQSKFNYFPIQVDDRATSAFDIDADSAKASYDVSIRYYNQNTITWTGVQIDFEYNGVSHTENYSFTGSGVDNSDLGIYKNSITIDTTALDGIFTWEQGKDELVLTVTPVGEDSEENPVEGSPLKKSFIALFDAQTVEQALGTDLCGNGYFGTSYTTFAQDHLLRELKNLSTLGQDLRCGNMSLPFGGPMNIAGMVKDTYQHGLQVELRTTNSSQSAQDDYDGTNATDRKADIDAYIAFSDSALTISQIEDEYDVSSNPTDKKLIYDYCMNSGDPRHPCDVNTTFGDLNHDMILQICQWYHNSGSPINGCPSGYLENVVRFSKWVKLNAENLQQTRNNSMISSTLATGHAFDINLYKGLVEDALVRGVWPDGKPIWAAHSSGDYLTSSRVMICHENSSGCTELAPAFFNTSAYLDAVEYLVGWRM